jgi:hypothetical protein
MRYDRKVFVHQFPIAKRFINHLTYYRVLHKTYTDRKLRNEFWTLTIDADLHAATIYWCMVFGSNRMLKKVLSLVSLA